MHRDGISTLKKAQERLIKQPTPWIKYLCSETIINPDSSIIVVGDTTHINNSSTIARLIAASAFELGTSLAYFDLSKKRHFEVKKQNQEISGLEDNIGISETINGCTEYNYLGGNQNVDWLLSRSFEETINLLKNKYDVLLLSASLDELKFVCASKKLEKVKLVIHAEKGKTKYCDIYELLKGGNIEIALTI